LSFADLPVSIDLRTKLPPVRNQGDRGTCVAYATAALREYLLGAQSTGADLSEQFLYWACKERDGYAGAGTWIKIGMDVLQELGVCPESVWPYDAMIVVDNEGHGPPPANAASEAAPFQVAGFTSLNARWIDALREVLANGAPVAVSMDVYQSCQRPYTYRMGDVRLPLPDEAKLGGHAMLLVGYVDDAEVPGGGYFIVRNSWGEAFGYDGEIAPGYCRLPYEYLRQYGIEAFTAELT
jgi:C1A family cysteine protease